MPSTITLNEHFPTFPALSLAVYVTSVVLLTANGGFVFGGSTVNFGRTLVLSSATGMVQLASAKPLMPSEIRISNGQEFLKFGGVLSV